MKTIGGNKDHYLLSQSAAYLRLLRNTNFPLNESTKKEKKNKKRRTQFLCAKVKFALNNLILVLEPSPPAYFWAALFVTVNVL